MDFQIPDVASTESVGPAPAGRGLMTGTEAGPSGCCLSSSRIRVGQLKISCNSC